jgi:murein DD-endopeptidase MepM/ murein hydrolase activator NlpD
MTNLQPGNPVTDEKNAADELPVWARLWQDIAGRNANAPVFRYARHALVLAIVIGFAVIAKSAMWTWLPAQIEIDSPTIEPTLMPTPIAAAAVSSDGSSADPIRILTRLVNGHTDFPTKPRSEVEVYSVQKGDTLFAVAAKYNIKPETILWSNYDTLKDNPDFLAPGQTLYILPIDGLYYEWQEGDRLDIIAAQYGVTPDDIILWPGNNLDPNIDLINPNIARGTMLVVPGGHREFQIHQWAIPVLRRTDNTKWNYGGPGACQGPYSSAVVGTGSWIYPTDSHWVVGTNYTDYHPAIDLYGTLGVNIYAADSGVVVYAGWNNWGYGNLTVIDHGNGWQTVYGHQSAILVFCGANVTRGNIIGQLGSTGNSTGPHLHFEMLINGVHVNPLNYLH